MAEAERALEAQVAEAARRLAEAEARHAEEGAAQREEAQAAHAAKAGRANPNPNPNPNPSPSPNPNPNPDPNPNPNQAAHAAELAELRASHVEASATLTAEVEAMNGALATLQARFDARESREADLEQIAQLHAALRQREAFVHNAMDEVGG